ncbi:MAG: CRISPR-associated endoribonuclease Cas6 [Candidatus Methanofastidiosa archaeon]|jgi:CRISPR-associated endoribonuclease Cas6|nr:CRISPR-associated endoribonuclease Cas6 [Candidatus Methanofastidiosa archaeon]
MNNGIVIKLRFKLTFSTKDGLIPYNYNYYIGSFIYSAIERADSNISENLHYSNDIKLFTFSDLKGVIPVGEKGLLIKDKCYFYFSSPRKDISVPFVEGLFKTTSFHIAGVPLNLEAVEAMKDIDVDGSIKFRTISPICITTKINTNDKLKIWDLTPTDIKFYKNLERNLIKKYRMYYGKDAENCKVNFEVSKIFRSTRRKIKNTFHTAHYIEFRANGSSDLIKLGYDSGFGEKNSMGFGMVEVMENGR